MRPDFQLFAPEKNLTGRRYIYNAWLHLSAMLMVWTSCDPVQR